MSDSLLDSPDSPPQNDGGESSASQPPTDGGSQAPSSVQDSPPEENSGDTSPPSPPQSPESTESPSPATQRSPASPPPSSPPPSPPASPPPSPDPPETSQSAPSPTSSEPPPSSPPPSSPPPEPSQKSPPPSASKSEPSPAPEKPSTPRPTSGSNRPAVTPPSQPFPLSPEVFTPPSPERGPPAPPRSITPPSKNDGGRDAGGSSTSQPSPNVPEVKSSKVPPSSNGKGEHGNDKLNEASRAIVGAILGGGLLIIILAIVLVARRKKKRKPTYPPQYMPPGNFPVKQDGFYHGQQPHSTGFSGPSNPSYGSQPPYSFGDSYVSSGGNGYSGAPDSSVISGGKIHFNYEDLMEMTNGFSRENIIGEGGFGCVYKGCLSDGRVVAIKQLKAGSGQGEREFRAEVEIISRVHHRYLVSLVGYCVSNMQRLLIYEFVPNNTLEHHLHAKGLPVLDWSKRLKIAIGSAKGLAYLHEDCHPKIIHRDIKSANILLDDDFEAQVADFGLARLNDSAETHVSTRVMGTFGYLAPEYASSGKLTDRSDVYSFGVVLLELITGRKPIDQSQPLGDESLVEWARPLLLEALETGDLSLVVDERLGKHYVESEMIRMIETAAACVRHSGPKRPRMAQVVRALDSDDMGDLTNGIKYGQSVAFNIGQHNEELMKFRRMALAESGELIGYSGEYGASSDVSQGYTSGESETRAINRPSRQYV